MTKSAVPDLSGTSKQTKVKLTEAKCAVINILRESSFNMTRGGGGGGM